MRCCIFGSSLGRKCLTRLKPDTARGTAAGLEPIHGVPFSGSFRQRRGIATHPFLDDSAGSPASQPIMSVLASTLVPPDAISIPSANVSIENISVFDRQSGKPVGTNSAERSVANLKQLRLQERHIAES